MFFMCLALWLIAGIERPSTGRVARARSHDGRARADARECAAAHRGDRVWSFYGVLRSFYERSAYDGFDRRTSAERRRTFVEQLAAVRRRPGDRACCRSWLATTRSTAASTSRPRSSAPTSTSATTRMPTAPMRRSGSAAARRSSSALDATEVARGSRRPHALTRRRSRASGPGARSTSSPRSRWQWLQLTGRKVLLLVQPRGDARHREPGEPRRILDAAVGARMDRTLRAAGAAGGARHDRDVAGSAAAVAGLCAGCSPTRPAW